MNIFKSDDGYYWSTELYYWLNTKFTIVYEMLSRMLYWGWVMRNNYDFDSTYMLIMLHNKLTKMHNCFDKHGICVWNRDKTSDQYSKMKSLKLCITLLDRLIKDEYDGNFDFDDNIVEQLKRAQRIKTRDNRILFTLINRDYMYWWD